MPLPAPEPPARAAQPARAPQALLRRLGFWATSGIVVGTIIGSGIFRVPAVVADAVGSPAAVAVVWIVGGLITLCGALAMAELAAALPETGGVFVYLRTAYGPLAGFLFGWTQLILAPASAGGVALVFAEYLSTLLPLSPTGVHMVASAVVLLVGGAAYRSVGGLGALVSVASFAKLAALAALVIAAFALGHGNGGALSLGATTAGSRWGGLGLALVSALWAYNGFHDMVGVAGEVRDPDRVLPRALLAGTVAVIVVYLGANAAYLHVLPMDVLRRSPLVATDTMTRVLGSAGGAAVAVMVMTSTFGTVMGLVLATPRIFYAMAGEGLLFASLARVHPRFRTPHVAVAVYTAVGIVSVWSRTFEQLAEAFVLGTWPFLALAVGGVFVLRRTQPDLPRPYRTPGYPVVPLVFIGGTAWVVISALVAHPVTTLAGIGLTLLGVPIHFAWRAAAARRRPATVAP
jgi:amino acid transporter